MLQFLWNACLDATKGTLYPPVSPGSLDMLIIFCGWNGAAETPTDCALSTDLEIELLAYITNEDHQFSSKKKKGNFNYFGSTRDILLGFFDISLGVVFFGSFGGWVWVLSPFVVRVGWMG